MSERQRYSVEDSVLCNWPAGVWEACTVVGVRADPRWAEGWAYSLRKASDGEVIPQELAGCWIKSIVEEEV